MQEQQADGSTLRETLLAVQKMTGRPQPELLNPPELPQGAYYVWSWFLKLNSSRGSNGFGVNPLSYTEMKCFFDLEGVVPTDWELEILKKLDAVAIESYAKSQKKQEESSKKKK